MTAKVLQFPKALKPHDEAYHAAVDSYHYFNDAILSLEKALVSDGRGVIAGMHNLFGGFRPEIKDKFLSFLNKPSFDSWLGIRDYLVDLNTTSWKLWIKYDACAPRSYPMNAKEGAFPKPEDFIRYYAQHRSERLVILSQKRDEALAIINTYQ